MKELYRELLERQQVLESMEYSKEALGRQKELNLMIVRVQQLLIPDVVKQSELLACDCDRKPLRYNELGYCKYCGKQKPSEG